jgi:serralysin
VNYATTDDTATAPGDYVSNSGTLTFSAGEITKQIIVQVNGDTQEESNEFFYVNLSNISSNATIGDGQGIGTITDEYVPQLITWSFLDGINGYNGTREKPTTNHGSRNRLTVDGEPDLSTLLYWDITSIPPGSAIQSVDITANVTNMSAGQDYEFYQLQRSWIESEATWNEYSSGQSWQVPGADGTSDRHSTVLGSLVSSVSGSTTISLNASGIAVVQSWVNNPSSNNGLILMDYINADNLDFSSRETATISDRPKLTVTYSGDSQPSLAIDDVTVTEGNTGTINASFMVSLSSATDQEVTVDYATADGSATAPDDYVSDSGTLTFSPGITTQTITVMVNGDVIDEADETFLVNLSNPVNAAIADNQGVGTITDNDPPPSLAIDNVSADEGVGTFTFTVSLSASSGQAVDVDFTTVDGTAVAPVDYTTNSGTLTIPTGASSGTITVTITDDLISESDETFTVDLSNAVNAVIADNQGVGTITDNDGTTSLLNVPEDYPTIQEAFNAALNGDTILVAPGVYQENIDMADKSVFWASWLFTTQDTSAMS